MPHTRRRVGSDIVFANDKEMMKEAGEHMGFIVKKGEDNWQTVTGKKEIAKAIYEAII